jgi:hypothetical protein
MIFQSQYRAELPYLLTDEDWDILMETYTFLKPFWQATLGGEKANSSLAHALATMDKLLLWFEKQKVLLPSTYSIISNTSRWSTATIHACVIPLIWAGSFYLSITAYLTHLLPTLRQSFFILRNENDI